ncbi:MAG: stage III sporulation protein AF [Clostridia bacterium]|nr:stage III sporulation protein AF [Clostridia bacterium]
MKAYLMSIVFAVLISVFAGMILPDKWDKYIKIITGLIIISTIVTPLQKAWNFSYDGNIREYNDIKFDAEEYRSQLISEELSKKIKEDISKRLSEEFHINPEIRVLVGTNEDNEITGVKKIELNGDNLSDKAADRLKEIYAPEEVIINGVKKIN